ncbi:type I restriction endonuclease subunit R [Methanococcus voltae]|uniref:Type III restriction protein res subunit n=1 Tax=Methanococcus voltae (strain ATCC BAA-1334 / A3) TaxID=456320 RepID=D7DSR6_METV3|nr:DEAD/DEAH box helicase family protein [Methanococcus voltae]MCS3901777.1 type I restriction enzyme R subunit [Methanococcus voltae]
MITPITDDDLKERKFQTIIKEYLTNENNYVESFNKNYDKHYAIDKECLFNFLELTQKNELKELNEIYGDNYRSKIIENLDKQLRIMGIIHILKHGYKDMGVKLKLAYFKPANNLNADQNKLYGQNIVSVTEELNYTQDKRIDLVIFLNGMPITTIEVKNPYTGQTYKNAIKQYKKTRFNTEKLFKFKERAIINFAMDEDQVYMTTQLKGEDTIFLPFNLGVGDGAGNPNVTGKLKTYYMWENILTKDSLLEIIGKFVYVQKQEHEVLDDNGDYKIITTEKTIFPRYHQLDCTRDILNHVIQNGSGQKYLIQHSAGSGKTNSITWLSHRLSSLHDKNDKVIFDGVIVVTDRKVLDKQLQDSIYQLEHKTGVVAKIDKDSNQLAKEIEKGTKIIISTIQKFPHVLKKLADTKGKKYAIVIDEAHSSTSGKNMMALKESLSLDEAIKIAEEEESQEIDSEDKINKELKNFTDQSNVSFFAYTATPKATTLRLFGTKSDDDNDDKYYPFHIYSMRQAIEEGFILDVLKNYMTYKMCYKVSKTIEEDPEFDKARATKSIMRYVTLHPCNISQKTEIIIEHFRNYTMKKIGGHAKAMLITPSRLHAVRYKLEFDKYIKEKGYDDLKTLVAFSGTVKDTNSLEYTESGMNEISQANLPVEFDKEESKILIVANKYQTGFDQPKLHTMYIDKKLFGVKAVQTLSRLNRIYPGKEDTFILDFVNEPEDIQRAFMPFYSMTTLNNDIDPNDIYTLENEIYAKQVINEEDVKKFTDLFYKDNLTNRGRALESNYINNSLKRIEKFTTEETIEFKNLAKKFINLYNLIIQIFALKDSDIHRLNIYLRYLLKKIEIENTGGVDLTNKVILEYYSLKKGKLDEIELRSSDGGIDIHISEGGTKGENPDLLSNIIKTLNDKFGTEFSDSEKLAVEQISNNLKSNEKLKLNATANDYELFRLAFDKSFEEGVVNEFSKNEIFYGKILKDNDFKNKLIDLLAMDIYRWFNKING